MSKENKYIRSLVQSAQQGNNAVLRQLFEMNLKRIHSLSLRLMGNLQLARELTVSVFLNSSKQIKSYKPDILFSDWLIFNTINEAIQQLKNDAEIKKKNSIKGDEENISELQIGAMEQAILSLDNSERVALVLSNIENIPIEYITKCIEQPNEEETQKVIDGAIENLVKSAEGINSSEEVTDSINNFPREVEFDKKTTDEILNKIYDAADKEGKEKEIKDAKIKKKENRKREKAPPVKKKKTKEVKLPREKINNRKILFGAGILTALFLLFIIFTSGSSDWDVSVLSGSVKIGTSLTTNSGTMIAGDALETTSNSTAEINIPKVGVIEIQPLTIISKLGDKNTAKLKSGSIKTGFSKAKNTFKLLLPIGYIEDFYMGSSYSVKFEQQGEAIISVEDGWLLTTYRNIEMVIAAEYSVQYKSSAGFGIPYHNSASAEFIEILGQVTFNNNENSVNAILSMATQNDALSLWNLLQRVRTTSKQSIYDKLYELVPHPDEISSSDMLRLDKDKLLLWLENIEWQM